MSDNPQISAEHYKANTRDSWNRAASGWNEHTPKIHGWLAGVTQTMLDLARIGPGARVLDVAAGAGDQTLDIARRVGPTGHVLATDISAAILEFAIANARQAGLQNVETKVADSENLGLSGAGFDAAICRLGLMFSLDPVKSLQEMRHAIKPGGRVCVLVFSRPEHNPSIGILMQTALKHAGREPGNPYQPGSLFSLGKPGHIDALFVDAGFQDVVSEVVSVPFNLPSATDYLDFIRSSASPIIQMLSKLDERGQAAAWVEMEQRMQAYQTSAGWQGPNELLLASGGR